jgi:glycerol-3-phosphate acyltransferase PlsX
VQPEYLLQFALLGACYVKGVLKKPAVSVGLLNIGTEQERGTRAPGGLSAAQIGREGGRFRFFGQCRGARYPDCECDVLVADGFSGNIALKTIEGTALYFSRMIKGMFKQNVLTMLAAVLTGRASKR